MAFWPIFYFWDVLLTQMIINAMQEKNIHSKTDLLSLSSYMWTYDLFALLLTQQAKIMLSIKMA